MPYGTPYDTMIIESLEIGDEANDRFEGRFIEKYLKMCDFNPEYYYIRTKKELEFVSNCMIAAQKTLFVSCHGGKNHIDTTLEEVSFNDFAKYFAGKLNGKRVLGSFCLAGREQFAKALYKENPDMSCFIAPIEVVPFQSTYPFWTTFFALLKLSEKNVAHNLLTNILSICSHLFNMEMAYYHKRRGTDDIEKITFDPQTISADDCEKYKNIVKIINKIP